jgi:hypothetical protein
MSHNHSLKCGLYCSGGNQGGNPALHTHLKAAAARTGTCRHHESRLILFKSLFRFRSILSCAVNCNTRHIGIMTTPTTLTRNGTSIESHLWSGGGHKVTRKVGISVITAWMIATTTKVELFSPSDDDLIKYSNNLDGVGVWNSAFASTHVNFEAKEECKRPDSLTVRKSTATA